MKVITLIQEPKKRGRPRIHPDRRAYKAMMERERRKRIREAKLSPSSQAKPK